MPDLPSPDTMPLVLFIALFQIRDIFLDKVALSMHFM